MKQIKLLGILAIALSLGLAACNNGGNDQSQGGEDQSQVEPCKKHDWETVILKEATCTEDGQSQRVCKVCGTKEDPKTIKAAHKWGEWVKQSDSTCVVAGKDQRECTVCHVTEQRDRALAAHTNVQDPDNENIAPTCTETGTNYYECSVCHEKSTETVQALGHLYEKNDDGTDKVVWTVNASCTVDGVGTKTCTREGCGHVEDVTETKWGHKMVTAETTPSDPGKAAVRVYHCTNPGCEQTYFGFKAIETGPNSGRLVEETDSETGEVGKRFWGRPIGNDVELDENGSADRDNHDAVFNDQTQGDLFEYNFDLTQAQIDIMGDTVVCYVDAKPADYLGGQDFWACDPSSEEWTRGYYIEGEKKGQPIDTYRYILYVDGHPVDFDSRMKAPVPGSGENLPRGEFLMPYIFHFTAGSHSISLRMAGGYRSIFYNFTFRPYDVPGDIDITPAKVEIREGETQQLTSTLTGLTFTSGSNSTATVDENGLVTGVKAGTTKITVSKEGNYFDTEVPVTIKEKLGVVVFEAEEDFTSDPADAVLKGAHSEGGAENVIKTFPKDATYSKKFRQDELAGKYDLKMVGYGDIADLSAAMSLKIDGNAVDVAAVAFQSTAGQSGSGETAANVVIASKIQLALGEHTIAIKALGDVMPEIDSFRLDPSAPDPEIPEPAAPTWPENAPALIDTSAWTAGTTGENAAHKTYTQISGDGKVGVKIAFADVSDGQYDGSKLPNSAGNGVKYQVKAPKAGIYQMIMKAKVSGSSGTDSNFSSRGLIVKVNGWASQSNIYGSRLYGDAGLDTSERRQFVVALVNLTGEEDTIYIEQPFYRFDFDTSSEVIFAEQ